MLSPGYADLDEINDPDLRQLGINLKVLRLDKLHPLMSGNKFFKLKNNIEYAQARGYKQLASFGGAYSNHIHTLAMAGALYGIKTVGLIRGERYTPLNPTLQDAVDAGMELHYLDRSEYKKKQSREFLTALQAKFPLAYFIPEGGSNGLGVEGCMDIVSHIRHHCNDAFDVVTVPCGTAATLAGIAAAAPSKQVWGFSVLKNSTYLENEVRLFHNDLSVETVANWTLFHDFHGGGYAKVSHSLADFMVDFEDKNNIPIEPVYSGKMFYGLYQLLKQKKNTIKLTAGANIVAIHTGGLQGLRGMASKLELLCSVKS